ncbi:MAG TPA: hypothetical protein VK972_03640, partial [Wenzhouxiangella sp.]|nr:hypothetical protein [Wenzhouxiangella sp.]
VFSQNITNWGIINTRSLVGDVIATPRRSGWAVRMKIPNFNNPKDRVLEFGRWETADLDDTLPNPDPNDPASQDPSQWDYPQLDLSSDDTAFWLNAADGSAYIRGHLTVGGNARFWTGSAMGNSDNMVQIDNEFPIAVVNKGDAISAGFPSAEGANVAYDATLRAWVRSNALFWVQKNGWAGFNTRNTSIFVGDTPLEAPASGGGITVKTRLSEFGEATGRGRVWTIADFSQASNKFEGHSRLGITYLLYLADASTDYGKNAAQSTQMSQVHVPTSRNSVVAPNGERVINLSGAHADFMDTHFIIVRAPNSSTGSESDPGWNYFKQWEAEHQNSIHHAAAFYSASNPNRRIIQGYASTEASGNYKVLVVAVERYQQSGNFLYGSIDGMGGASHSNNESRGACIALAGGSIYSQQISTRAGVSGSLAINSGADGAGGGTGGDGDDGGGGSGGGAGGGLGGGAIVLP